jgi:hypothetical protein
VIKKLLLLLVFSCFLFAQNELALNTVDKKDKAEVKKIEQKIITEKYEEAQKELEIKKNQELHLIIRLERSISLFALEKDIRKLSPIEALNISENIKV